PAAPPPTTPVLSPWPPLRPVDPLRDADATPPLSPARPVAYFCAEFGLHESLPIYSGGLGVLAGDHVKAAHDARLPLVGIGLFYRRGFLRQHVSVQGEQVPFPIEIHPREQPVTLVRDAEGAPLRVELDLPGTRLVLVAWRVDVGNVPLYLLDADVPDNRPEDRSVTHRLYTGDAEARLRQEIVLGKGGMRLLARLGIDPAVVHMNEGHAAFAPLERVSRLVHQAGLTFDEAAAMVRASTVFTTHTPVPAGHDRFPEPLLRRYFADAAAWLGIPWERFLALGRVGGETEFNMTVLGIRMSAFRNAVSRLHGEVSRRLLGASWPGLLPDEVPVTHVTNGVHLATWTAPALGRVLGAADRSVVAEDFSSRAADVDLDALWAARTSARRATLAAVRRHVREACQERSEPASVAERLTSGFTEDALLLGFARRFATYKRADLLLRDVRRLEALVHRADRPVRFLFAGKAHPSDRAGQEVLRRVVEASRRDGLAGRLLFLDDYDIGLARELVRGVDVWVNTPIRGLEASGTSGMKAAANGALHLSIRDGWWDEAFDGTNGFVIGGGTPGRAATAEANDDLDAASLYRVLEEEVVPLFFDRDAKGVPRRWLERVRRCLSTLPPTFDARRMLDEYADRAYRPLAEAGLALARDGYAAAREAAERQRRLRAAFPAIRFTGRRPGSFDGAVGGVELEVVADLDLAGVSPDDLVVEALATGHPGQGRVLGLLAPDGATPSSTRAFRGRVVVPHDGPRTLAVRVRARSTGPADAAGLETLVLWG
ncbi:MAG: alpha-glucan family phosphorylase, partial [Planctomycetia bacterium]|nr:alpha-glucan family phosphorylase [Planctomycetia bacterium]